MHKRHAWLLMLALAIALMMAAPAFAQTTPFDIGEGYSVTIPEGWIRAGRLNGGFAFISQNTSSVIYGPEAMQDLTRAGTRGTPRTALAAVYRTLYEEPMDTTGIYNQKIDGRDAAVWYYIMGTRQEGVFAVITLDERMTYMGIDITTPVNESGPAEDQIQAIVASLTSEGAAASSTSNSADASGEPCFVSTDAADTARLRVGPGFNRTSVAFLPAGTGFEVSGQAIADDQSVWFKLDKDEVAPQSAASEVWVLSEDVETEGGCDAVATVGGSPVIPIISAPPAQSGGSGSSGSDAASASASTVPLGGTWTVTFARQSNASCAGYANVVMPTHEIWEDWDESDYVWTATMIVNGNTSFTFDGDVYRANGGNEYVGNWDFEQAGLNTYLYWRVNSPTSISGTMTGNILAPDGLACSGTTSFSAVHR